MVDRLERVTSKMIVQAKDLLVRTAVIMQFDNSVIALWVIPCSFIAVCVTRGN